MKILKGLVFINLQIKRAFSGYLDQAICTKVPSSDLNTAQYFL